MSSSHKTVGYAAADRLASIVRDESKFDSCGWCGGTLAVRGAERVCESCGVAVRFERESVKGALPAGLDGATKIGPYLCAEKLGSGGFGEVWRAWDARLSRWVALKVMHRGSSGDEVARFRREAQLAASLHHPNVAPVFEVGEDQRLYLAMQLIDGTTADRARLTVPQAVAAVRDVARAVHVAHEQGILHRDLKPANIMVDRGGRPFVLDFGLARTVGTTISATGDILGTPAFMAPEQARGGALDRRTDVYGLGATLYALLTGHPPHSGPTAVAVFRKIEEEEPVPPGGDADLATICLKALEKDPARRYPTASAFADDLERFLKGDAIQARPASLGYRLRKRVAKQPLLWALAAVTAVGLPAAAAFGVVQLARSKSHLQRALEEETKRVGIERHASLVERVRRRIAETAEERSRDLTPSQWQRTVAELEGLAGELEGVSPLLRGDIAMLLGREAEAVAEYSKAMPEGALGRARARLGLLQDKLVSAGSSLGQWGPRDEDVLGDLRTALKDAPAGERRLAQLYEAFVDGDYEAVARGASAEIALGGRTEEFYFLRGLVTGRESDFGEAIERNRGNGRAWFHRGACRLKSGDAKGAMADFDRALAIRPRFLPALVNRASAKEAGGDVEGALADLTQAIEIEPMSVAAWLNRGNLQPDLKRALADLDRAVDLAPDRIETRMGRAMRRLAAGDALGAKEDCDRALGIDPRSVAAFVNRSEVHKARGDAASALADLEAALKVDPACVQALVNRGILRRQAGDGQGALADYDAALTIDPSFALAYANRGNVRLDGGNLAGAAADFETFLRLAPRHAYAPMVRARLAAVRRELEKDR